MAGLAPGKSGGKAAKGGSDDDEEGAAASGGGEDSGGVEIPKPECNTPHGQWNDTVGQCECKGMFYGSNCENEHCPDFDKEAETPQDCSGHGGCVKGQCFCNAGWGLGEGKTGTNLCSDPICPIDCGAHGLCQENKCICQDGWKGPACREPNCKNDCSGHGTCSFVAPNSPAECKCEYGFVSADCSAKAAFTQLETCPSDCSGNGLCLNGKCLCQTGFTGLDCSQRACPPGTSGPDCQFPGCPRDCTGKGLCMMGACVCDNDHRGSDCSIPSKCWDSCSKICVPNPASQKCEICKGDCETLLIGGQMGSQHPFLSRALTLLDVGRRHFSSRSYPDEKARQPRLRKHQQQVSDRQLGSFWSQRN